MYYDESVRLNKSLEQEMENASPEQLIEFLHEAKKDCRAAKRYCKMTRREIFDDFWNERMVFGFPISNLILAIFGVGTICLLPSGIITNNLLIPLIPFAIGALIETGLFIASAITIKENYKYYDHTPKTWLKLAKKNLKMVKQELVKRGIKVNKDNEIIEIKNKKEETMVSIPINPKNGPSIDSKVIDSPKNGPKNTKKK